MEFIEIYVARRKSFMVDNKLFKNIFAVCNGLTHGEELFSPCATVWHTAKRSLRRVLWFRSR